MSDKSSYRESFKTCRNNSECFIVILQNCWWIQGFTFLISKSVTFYSLELWQLKRHYLNKIKGAKIWTGNSWYISSLRFFWSLNFWFITSIHFFLPLWSLVTLLLFTFLLFGILISLVIFTFIYIASSYVSFLLFLDALVLFTFLLFDSKYFIWKSFIYLKYFRNLFHFG